MGGINTMTEYEIVRRYVQRTGKDISEEEFEKTMNYTGKAPDVHTAKDTKVYVRDKKNDPWQEAYFCDSLPNAEGYPYVVYADICGKLCKRDEAESLRYFDLCIIAKEK